MTVSMVDSITADYIRFRLNVVKRIQERTRTGKYDVAGKAAGEDRAALDHIDNVLIALRLEREAVERAAATSPLFVTR